MLNKYAAFSERELNTKETKKLNNEFDAIKAKQMFLKKFLIGWIVIALFIGVIAFFNLHKVELYYLLTGCVLIYILIGYWVYYEQRKSLVAEQCELNYVLAKNKVKFINVLPLSYIELPEKEDEGVHYLFQLANDRILSLGGQDFYPNRYFPSDNFEILLCCGQANEIFMLQIYNKGKKIKPLRKIIGKEKWAWLASPNYPDPENFTIINGKLEELENLLAV